MTLEKHPTSIQLADGQSSKLDEIAAKMTLKNGSRFTRADVHRLALSAGIAELCAKLDGPASDEIK
jgi:hypothetical protein